MPNPATAAAVYRPSALDDAPRPNGSSATPRLAARRNWLIIAVALVVAAVGLLQARIGVGTRGLVVETGAVALLAAIALVYGRTGRSASLASAAEACAQLIAIGVLLEVVSYLVTRAGGPLRDGPLLRADELLGFDWDGWTARIQSMPRLAEILASAYGSILPQLAAGTLYLGLRQRAGTLLGMLNVSGAITVAISAFVPAIGHLPDAPHVPDFLALRGHTLVQLDLAHLQGLISFPSYHAAIAVIMALALWHDRLLRWPVMLLNMVMLVSTISDGGHYLVDVLAGVAIAVASAVLARRWFPDRAHGST
jgi:membrane-associated phospholipid phosphatase